MHNPSFRSSLIPFLVKKKNLRAYNVYLKQNAYFLLAVVFNYSIIYCYCICIIMYFFLFMFNQIWIVKLVAFQSTTNLA